MYVEKLRKLKAEANKIKKHVKTKLIKSLKAYKHIADRLFLFPVYEKTVTGNLFTKNRNKPYIHIFFLQREKYEHIFIYQYIHITNR